MLSKFFAKLPSHITRYLMILLLGSVSLSAAAVDITEYLVEAPFEDVRQDLGDAVINRGYKVDYESYLGDMLSRTSADVGGKKPSIIKLNFCSFVLPCCRVPQWKRMLAI